MGIRSEDFACQWCRTLSGIVSFMMFHDVANIAAVSHGSFLICPKMDRCNLIWYCIETVHGTQMCTLFHPTKIESCAFMWNMYTNIYPSPKIHESTIVVVCRFRGAWRATWQLVGIVGGQRFYAHSLGALVFYVFFHGKRLETLPETNSGQAPETLGLPGWQVWTVRFRGICWAPESWWREFDVTTMVQRMNMRMGRVCECSFVFFCWDMRAMLIVYWHFYM